MNKIGFPKMSKNVESPKIQVLLVPNTLEVESRIAALLAHRLATENLPVLVITKTEPAVSVIAQGGLTYKK